MIPVSHSILKPGLWYTKMAYAEGSHIHLCFSWGLGFNFYIETGFLWPTTEAIDEAFYIVFSNNDVD